MRLSRVAVLGVLLLVASAGVAAAQGGRAGAEIEDAEGNAIGNARLTEDSGGTQIVVEAEGLEPGEHGIHVHATGDCNPSEFDLAGPHFNPGETRHGLENPDGPHAGDLPALTANEDGEAAYGATTDRVTLSEGEQSLLDGDGSALIIHAEADDQMTDPTGESGDRISCGVIEASTVAALQGAPGSGSGFVVLMLVLAIIFILAVGIFLLRRG